MEPKGRRRRLSRYSDILFFAVYLAAFVLHVIIFPLMLPDIAADDKADRGVFVFPGIMYLVMWLLALLGVVDSAAYIYGFKRPFIAERRSRRFLRNFTVKSGRGFVMTSLLSYALTLYGFSIAYALISTLDPTAFNVRAPLEFSTAVYFTVSTAATVGFGDIAPVSRAARLVTTLEILISFLYLIFIFSTISGLARGRIADTQERK